MADQPWTMPDTDRLPMNTGTGGIQPLPEKPSTREPKTSYRTLKPTELPPGTPPGIYQQSSEGKIEKVADMPKVEPDLQAAVKGLGIDELLTNIGRARAQIKTGFATGVLGSLAGHFPGTPRKDFLGSLEGIKGAAILEKLQSLRDQSKNGSSGMGSLTEQEGERLASSITSLNQDMSADELNKSLDIMERHAKALQAVGAGKDPTDPAVQHEYGLLPLPGAAPAAGNTPPPENPIANNTPGDQGPMLTPSNGETRSVIDPKKQALGQQIVSLVSKGAPPNVIMGFAVGADPSLRSDPKFHAWVSQAIQYRQQHPHAQFSIDPGFYTTEVPLSGQEKAGNAVAQSAPGAAAMNFSNAVSAGNLGNVMGDEEGVDRALAVANAQHPVASLAGNVGGGATAALGIEGLLGKAGMAPGLLRGALADAGYGGVAGAASDQNGNLAARTLNGALYGAGGSLVGQGLLKVPGAATRGVTSPTVGYLEKELPGALTIGQAVSESGLAGRTLKRAEDAVSSIPYVGDAINARRVEGFQKMNSKAFDKALEPISENVAGQFGEDAVAAAQDKVGQAFRAALGGKVASIDHQFIADATQAKNAISKLPPSISGDVESLVDSAINDYFDHATGTIKGEDLHALLRELEGVKSSYYSQNHAAKDRIGKAVDRVVDSVEDMWRRQEPSVMPEFDAAKKAFKRVSTLESAVLAAKNTNGVFTPAQLGTADVQNTIKYGGKHAAAAGKREFFDYQRAVQNVLPSKVPDSGTVTRAILPALAVGAGGGADAKTGNTGIGLTLGGLIALAYTKRGQRALVRSVTGRGATAQRVGNALSRAGQITGAIGGSQAALGPPRD